MPSRGIRRTRGSPRTTATRCASSGRGRTRPAASSTARHRDVVTVTGPDRLSWLHSLTSQHLTELAPGQGVEALVLSPNGHVEHHLVVLDDGGTTWIDVEGGTGAALVAFLDKMRFMLRVEVALVTDATPSSPWWVRRP